MIYKYFPFTYVSFKFIDNSIYGYDSVTFTDDFGVFRKGEKIAYLEADLNTGVFMEINTDNDSVLRKQYYKLKLEPHKPDRFRVENINKLKKLLRDEYKLINESLGKDYTKADKLLVDAQGGRMIAFTDGDEPFSLKYMKKYEDDKYIGISLERILKYYYGFITKEELFQ